MSLKGALLACLALRAVVAVWLALRLRAREDSPRVIA